MGKGVLKAVKNVETMLTPVLKGMDPTHQEAIDAKMKEIDGTPNKSNVGAVRGPPSPESPLRVQRFPCRPSDC